MFRHVAVLLCIISNEVALLKIQEQSPPKVDKVRTAILTNHNISETIREQLLAELNTTKTTPNFDLVALNQPAAKPVEVVAQPEPKPAPKPEPKPEPKSVKQTEKLVERPLANAEFEIPVTDIVGADKAYKPTQLIRLSVKPIEKKPANLRSIAYAWVVLPEQDYEVYEDSTKVIMSATQPQSMVMLTASYVFTTQKGTELEIVQRVVQTSAVIQVETTGIPNNPPGAGLPVGPNQPPAQLTDSQKEIYSWMLGIQLGQQYPLSTAKGHAKLLAKSFKDVKSQMDNNQVTDINAVLATTKAQNDNILDEATRTKWTPWFEKMRLYLTARSQNGQLTSYKDLQPIYADIVTVLEVYAQ